MNARARLGFGDGLRSFLAGFGWVVARPGLRRWYGHTARRCLVAATLVLAAAMFGGAYGFAHLSALGAWSKVASALWVFALLFFSGTLTVALMGGLVSLLVDERTLVSEMVGQKIVSWRPAPLGDRRRELLAGLRTFLLSLVLWPAWLFPAMVPIAVVILAVAMGAEACLTARRMLRQAGEQPLGSESLPLSAGFYIGLGLIPAMAAGFPLFGWVAWPLLLAGATRRLASTFVE
jgi:hypothetical protein